MQISRDLPEFSINKLKVKKESGMTTNDMENVFITEDLILSPMYEPISINGKTSSYKFFPYNDIRLDLYCNECKCRRIFAFKNSELAYINIAPRMWSK